MRTQRKPAVLAAGAGLLLTACGGEQPAEPAHSSTPHGYVEGAEEMGEAQSRLVLADSASGAVRVLDLTSGDITRVDDAGRVRSISTDGRFAYLAAGEATQVIDSGSWTVDHGDHVHYYRARIRQAGQIDGHAVAAHADSEITAVALENGRTTILNRPSLEEGRAGEGKDVDGLAVPYEQHLVVATGTGVSVRGRDGTNVAEIDEPCPEPTGTGRTRRGAVFGCADGALVVSEDDGTFGGEKIPYPEQVSRPERAGEFGQRRGSATLAATAGSRGAWSLNISERAWTLIETGPLVAAGAVGAGAPLLALSEDGVLHAYDPATGERTASRKLLDGGVPADSAPVIRTDTSRAYVNDPDGQRVYEIDYNDDLRIARTFELGIAPTHMVETGR